LSARIACPARVRWWSRSSRAAIRGLRQLGSFIAYKARKAGVPVVYVDPAYTSRTCAECGHTDKANRVSQARFACRSRGGIELTSPEVAERLSIAGTPAECAERIRTQIAPSGVNHVICAVTDRDMVRTFTGRELDGVADVNEQLRLISEQIMPAV
jgi:hypothetical protein